MASTGTVVLCRYSECLCQGKTASTNTSPQKKKKNPRENIYFLHRDTGKRSAFALSNRIGWTEFSIVETGSQSQMPPISYSTVRE